MGKCVRGSGKLRAMAQRSSRSKKARGRSAGTNKPELRSSKSRGSDRAQETTPANRRGRPTPEGPRLRLRPDGRSGLLVLTLGAWLVALLPIVGGWLLGQWGAFSYPDSLWLYVAIGMVVASVPVAWVARSVRDVNGWVVQAGLVSLGALGAEIVFGPACPPNGDCGAIGARGAWGIVGSLIAIAVLGLAARWIGVAVHRWVEERRPRSGYATAGFALRTMLGLGLLAGVPMGITLVAVDAFARDAPALGRQAEDTVGEYCFDLGQRVPELAVRADPVGKQPAWTSFLVRTVEDDRPGIKGQPLPDSIVTADRPTPYEAAISFDSDGDPVDLQCRRVSPRDGNADANDYAAPDYGATESTLDDLPPQFGSADNGGLIDPNAASSGGPSPQTAPAG